MAKTNGTHALSVLLRLAFAVALAASQFTSRRGAFFTPQLYLLLPGVLLTAAGAALWYAASIHLRRAREANEIAASGPYRLIRHPIYASIYVLSAGLGLAFFAGWWFAVLAAFVPLWWLECRGEERDLLARFGPAYRAYRERTAMWIPWIL
jgi:protein-S-isoprenylcysteine O-methyltransferase Ste14